MTIRGVWAFTRKRYYTGRWGILNQGSRNRELILIFNDPLFGDGRWFVRLITCANAVFHTFSISNRVSIEPRAGLRSAFSMMTIRWKKDLPAPVITALYCRLYKESPYPHLNHRTHVFTTTLFPPVNIDPFLHLFVTFNFGGIYPGGEGWVGITTGKWSAHRGSQFRRCCIHRLCSSSQAYTVWDCRSVRSSHPPF